MAVGGNVDHIIRARVVVRAASGGSFRDEDRDNQRRAGSETRSTDAQEMGDAVGHNRVAINFVWTLVTGFLVMFMQAGFALVESGLTRAKNASHTMAMNFMIYPMGMLGFYLCGFIYVRRHRVAEHAGWVRRFEQ